MHRPRRTTGTGVPHRHPRLRPSPAPRARWSPRRSPQRTGRATELVLIRTEGDVSTAPLAQIGGTGVFVSALRDALLRGEVDLAVHSLKDLPDRPRRRHRAGRRARARGPARRRRGPRRPHPRRAAGRRPRRHRRAAPASPRSRRSASGSTSSASAATWTPGIGKVASGELDAVVLARAGLARLGRARRGHRGARPDPGAARARPGRARGRVPRRRATCSTSCAEALDDPRTRACVEAERALLAELEAGCSAPVGALAEVAEGDLGDELWIRAVALSLDGALSVRRSASGPLDDAVGLGQKLAAEMLADGAAELINAEHRSSKKANVTNQNTSSTPADARELPAPARSGSPSSAADPATPACSPCARSSCCARPRSSITEVPEHEQLVRGVLGLPAPVEPGDEAAERAGRAARSRSSSTAASARTASR